MKNYMKIILTVLLITSGLAGYFLFQVRSKAPILELRKNDSQNSSEYLNAQKAVDYYRQQIEKNPDNIKNYVQLAQLFLQEARITGRHHEYIPKAEYLLDEALKRKPNDLEANVTKASVLLTRHKFEEAKPVLEKITAANPYYAYAYGALVDAYVELGEYDKAVITCDKMLSIRPDLTSYSRASYLRELHGDKETAIDAMQMAADAGVNGQENRAWVLCNLANLYLQEGKSDTAAFIFNGILQERPQYAYALEGLAAIHVSKKEYHKAIELLVRAAQITPAHIFIERLADLYKAMGNKEAEKDMVEKVTGAFDQHEKDGWNVDLEYARFSADHETNYNESLSRIKNEYSRRPENVEVLDTYAWVLHKMNRNNEAISFMESALRLNTFNPNILFHAGMIYKSAGKTAMAEKYLSKALTAYPYLNSIYMAEAKSDLNSLTNLASRF